MARSSICAVQGLEMVPLLRAEGAFHARVLAARLGSEGVVTQLRGGFDGPYPMGGVEVLVRADDLSLAQELLLADEVESAFSLDPGDGEDLEDEAFAVSGRGPWLLVLGMVVLLVLPLLLALVG
ncbi:hypothetical protein BH18ACT1_BH18ACT1_12020 [soil metagenome]